MNLKFKAFSFILLQASISSTFGYKCEFEDSEFVGYICGLKPDQSSEGERHLPGKSDDDVKRVEFNGYWNLITPLVQSAVPICERFKNLERIEVRKLKIDGKFFKKCGNLKKIFLINSEISELPESFLADNPKLSTFMLRGSKLTTLPENIFANQKELVELNLSGNLINFFPLNIFKPLKNLKSLYMDNNRLQMLNQDWFKSLLNLRVLSLSGNGIVDLPKNVLSSLYSLEQIYLESNKLTTIHADSFGIQNKLKIINLYNNKIDAIDEKLIDITAVDVMNMAGNVCSKEDIKEREGIKLKLRKCFENYRPRK